MKEFTSYQIKILNAMKDGAIMKCTEGKDYKVWLKYTDGKIENIRKDSAEKITNIDKYGKYFSYGYAEGIKLLKMPIF